MTGYGTMVICNAHNNNVSVLICYQKSYMHGVVMFQHYEIFFKQKSTSPAKFFSWGCFFFLFSYRLKLRSDEKRWGGLHDQPRVYYGGKLSLIFFPTLAERLIRILRRKQDQLKSLQKVLQSKNDKK